MPLRRLVCLALTLVLLVQAPLWTLDGSLTTVSGPTLFVYPGNHGFIHDTGMHNPYGWQADYRISAPGYLVRGLRKGGAVLPEGVYQYDFYFALRSGHLGGLLSRANDVVRIEAFDQTAQTVVIDRSFQMADFHGVSHQAVRRSLTFSSWGRPGHAWEPRIYWQGLSGIFLEKVELHALDPISLPSLTEKATLLEQDMDRRFIDEHGYVVVRSEDGSPEDYGDTAIWTGLYAAAEAWRFQATRSKESRKRMERALWALHALHAAAPTPGSLVRHVDAQGHVLPDAPSKDTYTGFFFAVGQCLPWVRDRKLRRALQEDVETLTDALIAQDLTLTSPFGEPVSVNPSLSPTFLSSALRDLKDSPAESKRWTRLLRGLKWYFWLNGQVPVPILSKLIRTLRHPEIPMQPSLVQALNDAVAMLRQLQRNVHHSAAMGVSGGLMNAPYAKLDLLLLQSLKFIDDQTHRQPIRNSSDLKILPSEALHALHWIKVASDVLPKPNRFDVYYHDNLFKNEALLQTVIDWSHMDELLLGATLGETRTSAMRNGNCHLSFLALYDLIRLEQDLQIRFQYQKVFEREMSPMRSDYNAMLWVMQEKAGLSPHQTGLALWSLERYPIDRQGRGDAYWRQHRRELIEAFGGPIAGKAQDPLPPDLRPRDAFLWQRSARSIRGDEEGWQYPPLDFLFAYWMERVSIQEQQPDGG